MGPPRCGFNALCSWPNSRPPDPRSRSGPPLTTSSLAGDSRFGLCRASQKPESRVIRPAAAEGLTRELTREKGKRRSKLYCVVAPRLATSPFSPLFLAALPAQPPNWASRKLLPPLPPRATSDLERSRRSEQPTRRGRGCITPCSVTGPHPSTSPSRRVDLSPLNYHIQNLQHPLGTCIGGIETITRPANGLTETAPQQEPTKAD